MCNAIYLHCDTIQSNKFEQFWHILLALFFFALEPIQKSLEHRFIGRLYLVAFHQFLEQLMLWLVNIRRIEIRTNEIECLLSEIGITVFLSEHQSFHRIVGTQFFQIKLTAFLFQQIELNAGRNCQKFLHIVFGQIDAAGVAKIHNCLYRSFISTFQYELILFAFLKVRSKRCQEIFARCGQNCAMNGDSVANSYDWKWNCGQLPFIKIQSPNGANLTLSVSWTISYSHGIPLIVFPGNQSDAITANTVLKNSLQNDAGVFFINRHCVLAQLCLSILQCRFDRTKFHVYSALHTPTDWPAKPLHCRFHVSNCGSFSRSKFCLQNTTSQQRDFRLRWRRQCDRKYNILHHLIRFIWFPLNNRIWFAKH